MICEQTAWAYCIDDIKKIENYHFAVNDNTQTWICHHKVEIQPDGVLSVKELKERNLYYHRPARELVFLMPSTHSALHNEHRKPEVRKRISVSKTGDKNPMFGKHHSDESKKQISQKMSGSNHPFFGKHHSDESKRKMSISKKGMKPTEHNRECCMNAVIGTHWFNNGQISIRARECPEGFTVGRLRRTK